MTAGAREADAVAWLESRTPAPPAALLERMRLALAAVAEGARSLPPEREAVGATGSAAGSASAGPTTGEASSASAEATVPALVAALGEAAVDRLRIALEGGDDRAAAYDLLAGDALLTYAFEAAADAGPDAVAACARAFGPARLAELLER